MRTVAAPVRDEADSGADSGTAGVLSGEAMYDIPPLEEPGEGELLISSHSRTDLVFDLRGRRRKPRLSGSGD